MFGIGGFELFLIIIFAFLIFGPDKLPEIANMAGKAIAKFRSAKDEMTGTLSAKSFLSDDPDQPIKNPIEVLEQAAAAVEAKRNGSSNAAGSGSSSGARAGAASASGAASAQSKKPGSAIENYRSFAERKAAYEKVNAAKAKAAQSASDPDGLPADSQAASGTEDVGDKDAGSVASTASTAGTASVSAATDLAATTASAASTSDTLSAPSATGAISSEEVE